MSTPPGWLPPERPVPPPPSGYEAHSGRPEPEPSGQDPYAAPPAGPHGAEPPPTPYRPAASGYLADTYPAQGYPPGPDDAAMAPAAPQGFRPPVDPYGQPLPGPVPGNGYGYGYGAAGYPPYGYPAPPRNEGIAIAALVTGIVSVVGCLVFAGPVAVGLGIVGLRNIRTKGTQGRGMAIAGIVTGAVATVALIFIVISIIVSATNP